MGAKNKTLGMRNHVVALGLVAASGLSCARGYPAKEPKVDAVQIDSVPNYTTYAEQGNDWEKRSAIPKEPIREKCASLREQEMPGYTYQMPPRCPSKLTYWSVDGEEVDLEQELNNIINRHPKISPYFFEPAFEIDLFISITKDGNVRFNNAVGIFQYEDSQNRGYMGFGEEVRSFLCDMVELSHLRATPAIGKECQSTLHVFVNSPF